MIERIVLFMPPFSQYQVLHHFTRQMHQALERNGIKCRLMEAKYDNPKPFLEDLFKEKPDATLSFNGLLPDNDGNFFSDMIKIPHIAYLVDSPNRFLPLIKSQYTIITCPDRFGCDFFKGVRFNKVMFLPHGIGKDESHSTDSKKEYDVVMLSSCLDYDSVIKGWKKQFPPVICDVMEEAVEITLHDNHTPYVQAFVSALDRQMNQGASINVQAINYPHIFEEIEAYLRAKHRIELVKAIDARIDIFGDGTATANWKKVLGNKKNVTIHPAVNYDKAIEIMKNAKIVLNSNPVFKNGSDERLFTMKLGALVITNDTIYTRENFKEDESIVFYKFGEWDSLNEKIKHYLSNEKDRQSVVKKGTALIDKHHTWDNRAQTLIKELPAFLA